MVVGILVLFALAGGKLLGAESGSAELDALFRRIVQSNSAAASIPEAFVEAPELWDRSEDFKKLEAITQNHWREMLDHLGTIAPDRLTQVIFFQSAHGLSQLEEKQTAGVLRGAPRS
ncbi:hypothetical protein CfE428DRAFT_5006 [Chthoniobacter flavus Ellin428]|uniref:Uncharacterized protein n=1 Tax=Chthoniobacter flavus Ellin428 TaxID=497964 RepID=B4D7W6_9BACT|nr:hypothetical protein CfE428DRAFT_5006 [Chthoniobacter flavus Ellin428]TCO92285.1 hypothetical protein EV701_10654 [Chthoniobacter flavus]